MVCTVVRLPVLFSDRFSLLTWTPAAMPPLRLARPAFSSRVAPASTVVAVGMYFSAPPVVPVLFWPRKP